MYTIIDVEIRHGIHWVKSIISEFENRFNVTEFPYKKEINDQEYMIINKTDNVFTT